VSNSPLNPDQPFLTPARSAFEELADAINGRPVSPLGARLDSAANVNVHGIRSTTNKQNRRARKRMGNDAMENPSGIADAI